MVVVAQSTFSIGGRTYVAAEWNVYRVVAGRVVRAHVSNYPGATTGRWLIPFRQGREFDRLALLNIYLADPVAWEHKEDARILAAEQSGSLFHSIVHSIEHGLSQVANVVVDTAEFGVQLDQALFHPLTVNGSGLQLSSDAIQLVPENLRGLAQTVTSVGGFAVLGAAAVTAVGGLGVVGDAVSGVSGALDTAQGVLGAVSSFLPTGVTPILPASPAAAVEPGVFDDATRGFAEGIGPFLLAGFVFFLLLKRKS